MWTKFVLILLAVTMLTLRAQSEDDDQPCNYLDVKCVRNHIITHSNCQTRTFKKIPNKVTISNFRFKAPYFNVTHVDQYITTTNLDKCQITGLTTNQMTRETNLELDCENLMFESMRAIIVHIAGQSAKYYVVKVHAEYDVVRLSINIRGVDNIDICVSTSTAWATLPTLLLVGQDRASVAFVREDPLQMFGARLHTWVRELWSYRAALLLRYWINNLLCDFECKLCEE